MPTVRPRVRSDYSILVNRGCRRPKADLIPFGVRDPIPQFPLPLRRGENELTVDLGRVLHALYDRASYDLRIDYEKEPLPPLASDDADWAKALVRERGTGAASSTWTGHRFPKKLLRDAVPRAPTSRDKMLRRIESQGGSDASIESRTRAICNRARAISVLGTRSRTCF